MPTSQPLIDAPPTLTVLGSRGSIPVSGPQFVRYGGNTTSFALEHQGVAHGFIDAGTGINAYRDHGLELADHVEVFLTHYHWDHMQGISMLGGVWDSTLQLEIFGVGDFKRYLADAISPPVFPVSLDRQENVRYSQMDGSVSSGSIVVKAFPVHHPGGAIGYRIEGPNRVVLVITDHESVDGDGFRPPADGVDTVIYDAQYLPSEVAKHRGWGHSTWEDAVGFAGRVGAESLVLTSHDPQRSDDEIDAMVAAARAVFPKTQAARPGLAISL